MTDWPRRMTQFQRTDSQTTKRTQWQTQLTKPMTGKYWQTMTKPIGQPASQWRTVMTIVGGKAMTDSWLIEVDPDGQPENWPSERTVTQTSETNPTSWPDRTDQWPSEQLWPRRADGLVMTSQKKLKPVEWLKAQPIDGGRTQLDETMTSHRRKLDRQLMKMTDESQLNDQLLMMKNEDRQ